VLPKDRNDLLFRKTLTLHGPVLSLGRILAPSGLNSGGHITRHNPLMNATEADDRQHARHLKFVMPVIN